MKILAAVCALLGVVVGVTADRYSRHFEDSIQIKKGDWPYYLNYRDRGYSDAGHPVSSVYAMSVGSGNVASNFAASPVFSEINNDDLRKCLAGFAADVIRYPRAPLFAYEGFQHDISIMLGDMGNAINVCALGTINSPHS